MADAASLEKIPPQNLEAEQSLLGALLIDKDAIIKVADTIPIQRNRKQEEQKAGLVWLFFVYYMVTKPFQYLHLTTASNTRSNSLYI